MVCLSCSRVSCSLCVCVCPLLSVRHPLDIPSIHQSFENKHVCNEFCKWFNIPTDYYETQETPSQPQAEAADSDSDPWLESMYASD